MSHSKVHVRAYSGGSVLVPAGFLVTITDPQGQQVGDLWALDAEDASLWLSVSHTRDRLERLFPHLEQSSTDQRGDPLLQYVADTSPGRHDTLYAACDRWLYDAHGLPGHPNCRDNYLQQVQKIAVAPTHVPDPVNLFRSSSPSADGGLLIGPAASRPGDRVTFRALRSLHVVLTACSVDHWPTNGDRCTPLDLEVTQDDTGTSTATRSGAITQPLGSSNQLVGP